METTALNDSYTKGCERYDRKLFTRWNELVKAFSVTGDTGVGGNFDVKGTLIDGRECMVEIKMRKCAHDTFDSAMIEADKMTDGWIYDRFSGLTSLYVNFYTDGWSSVFNLNNLKHAPRKEKTRRKNPGMDDKVVENAVYFLDNKDGVFYDDSGRLHRDCV